MRSRNALYNISTNLILQLIVIIYGFVVPKIIINSFQKYIIYARYKIISFGNAYLPRHLQY